MLPFSQKCYHLASVNRVRLIWFGQPRQGIEIVDTSKMPLLPLNLYWAWNSNDSEGSTMPMNERKTDLLSIALTAMHMRNSTGNWPTPTRRERGCRHLSVRMLSGDLHMSLGNSTQIVRMVEVSYDLWDNQGSIGPRTKTVIKLVIQDWVSSSFNYQVNNTAKTRVVVHTDYELREQYAILKWCALLSTL